MGLASLVTPVRHIVGSCVYKNQTGDESKKQDTQANKRTRLLREEVPYQMRMISDMRDIF